MTTTCFDSQQLANFITAIAAAIPGATVTRDADHHPHGFTLPEDVRIWISYSQREHRFHISGLWPHSRVAGETHTSFTPREVYPHVESPSISISATKAPAAIAAEIKRRFLPGYTEVLKRCLEARQRHEDYIANQNNVADRVAALLGQPRRGCRLGSNEGTQFDLPKNLTNGSGYGSITVQGESVRCELRSLTADQGARLIEFLKTL